MIPNGLVHSQWPDILSTECSPDDDGSNQWALGMTAKSKCLLQSGAFPELFQQLRGLLDSDPPQTNSAPVKATSGEGRTTRQKPQWKISLSAEKDGIAVWDIADLTNDTDPQRFSIQLPTGSAVVAMAAPKPLLVGRLGSDVGGELDKSDLDCQMGRGPVRGRAGDILQLHFDDQDTDSPGSHVAVWSRIYRPLAGESVLSLSIVGDLLIVLSAHLARHTIRLFRQQSTQVFGAEPGWDLLRTLCSHGGTFSEINSRNNIVTAAVSTLGVAPARLTLWPRAGDESRPLARVESAMQTHVMQAFDGSDLVMQLTDGEPSAPLVVYCYAGFGKSTLPTFSATMDCCWLQRGGRYAIVHARGGGDCGHRWRNAGKRAGKVGAQRDLGTALEYLFDQGLANPERTGLHGMSNGAVPVVGALVSSSVALGCAAIQVPIADLGNFHRLSPGDTWLDEYGDPRVVEDARILQEYNPLRLARTQLPTRVLVTAFTGDEVTPVQHARALAVTLDRAGTETYYQENSAGTHTGSVSLEDRLTRTAELWNFFHQMLM